MSLEGWTWGILCSAPKQYRIASIGRPCYRPRHIGTRLSDGRLGDLMASPSFTVEPVTPVIGAEVHGVDLTRP
ncbi:MAG: hypothetical protein R3285_09735, partial [Kiloniellales bacterium]|nr:hypothetical protein [Kiloniellales bacterium]